MERFACASPEIRITLVFWLTSKMSHERGRRDSCASRRRDGRDRWLWRLVSPILHWVKMSHFKLELRRFGLSGEDLGKDTIFGGPIIVCRQRCGFLLREIVFRERIRVGDQVVTNEKEEVRL